MGKVKRLWEREVDNVGDNLANGVVDRPRAIAIWIGLGLGESEAEDMADAVEGIT